LTFNATHGRPNFETATYLGSLALAHSVDYMRAHGLTVDDLAGADAVRSKVLDSLSRNDPAFFTGVGHGNTTTFTGQNFNGIWWSCDCKELRDRVVYLLSCYTGAGLGPDMVSKGVRCYIGYKVTFTWIQERIQDPTVDRYGKSFFEPVLEILNRLADGHTMGEAFRASLDRWNYWIDYWSRSTDPEAPVVLTYLIHDRDGQVLIGDETARIVSAVPILTYVAMAVLGSLPVLVTAGITLYSEATKPKVVV
jgi:hypothetical protein